MGWAKLAGVEPMMALNLGTRGVQEACDLLEYCNHGGGARYGAVPVLDAVAVYSEEEGELSVFAVNRGDEPLRLAMDLRDLDGMLPVRHTTVAAGAHPDAINTAEAPDRVLPVELAAPDLDGGRASVTLPAISWNLLRFTARPL